MDEQELRKNEQIFNIFEKFGGMMSGIGKFDIDSEEIMKENYKSFMNENKKGMMLNMRQKIILDDMVMNDNNVKKAVNMLESNIFKDFHIEFNSYNEGVIKEIQENSIYKWDSFIRESFIWYIKFGAIAYKSYVDDEKGIIYPITPNIDTGNFFVKEDKNNQSVLLWKQIDKQKNLSKWKTYIFDRTRLSFTRTNYPSPVLSLVDSYSDFLIIKDGYYGLLHRLFKQTAYLRTVQRDERIEPKDMTNEQLINPMSGMNYKQQLEKFLRNTQYKDAMDWVNSTNMSVDERDSLKKMWRGEIVDDPKGKSRPNVWPLPPNSSLDFDNPGVTQIPFFDFIKKFQEDIASALDLGTESIFGLKDVKFASSNERVDTQLDTKSNEIRKMLTEMFEEIWESFFPYYLNPKDMIAGTENNGVFSQNSSEPNKEKGEIFDKQNNDNYKKLKGKTVNFNLFGKFMTIFVPANVYAKNLIKGKMPKMVWTKPKPSMDINMFPIASQMYQIESPDRKQKLLSFDEFVEIKNSIFGKSPEGSKQNKDGSAYHKDVEEDKNENPKEEKDNEGNEKLEIIKKVLNGESEKEDKEGKEKESPDTEKKKIAKDSGIDNRSLKKSKMEK